MKTKSIFAVIAIASTIACGSQAQNVLGSTTRRAASTPHEVYSPDTLQAMQIQNQIYAQQAWQESQQAQATAQARAELNALYSTDP